MTNEPAPPTISHAPHIGETHSVVVDHDATGDYVPDAGFTPLPEIPGYDVQKELGRGGMGVVFLAVHCALKRPVALKMLLHASLASEAVRVRFQTEMEALAALQHPNIVQIFERGTFEGMPYFAMEYCPGGALAQRIHDNPLPPTEAARIVEQLARAMAAAHERHILHRDLKPANILATSDGTLKISDFGLAKRLDGDEEYTQTNAVLGTPSYMAPEQAAGKPVGPAADIYGLGAILYRVLVGRPPFVGNSHAVTLQLVIAQDPLSLRQLDPSLSRDIETICMKCLHKNPAQRYANAVALADDLARYLRHEPIQARPATPLERGWKWTRRNPSLAALGLVLVVLFGTIVGASSWIAYRESQTAQEQFTLNGKLRNEQIAKDDALQRERIGSARLALDRGQMLCTQSDIARGLLAMVAGLEPAQDAQAADIEEALRFNIAAWQREMWPLRERYQGPTGTYVIAGRVQPHGGLVAIAFANNQVELRPRPGQRAESRQLPHESVVLQLDFDVKGERLLTRTAKTVRIWEVATSKILAQLEVKDYSVAAINSEGTHLAYITKKGVVQLHRIGDANGIDLRQMHPANILQFAPGGKQLLTANLNEVRRWTLSGESVGTPLLHDGMIWSAQYNQDASRLVVAVRESPRQRLPVVSLWDAESGQRLLEHTFTGGNGAQRLVQPRWKNLCGAQPRRLFGVTPIADGRKYPQSDNGLRCSNGPRVQR